MDKKQEQKEKISRRSFLQVAGSVAAGGFIMAGAGSLVYKMFADPEGLFYEKASSGGKAKKKSSFVSPYKKISQWQVPEEISSFELLSNGIAVASSKSVSLYDLNGKMLQQFHAGADIMDIALSDGLLYVLMSKEIAVFDLNGKKVRGWAACDENADYCALTVFGENVFVTDAQNKLICKYLTDGTFVKFIKSPQGFVVPSYSFGITHIGNIVYCSNPGRHAVESYSADGEFLASFGKAGIKEGMFSGCCNPVHLTATSSGEIVTSEKGLPRICCYGSDGTFRSVLLDEESLGGGHEAYEVRICNDQLLVAGKKSISTYQFDKDLAMRYGSVSGKCLTCEIDCPLREGVTI